MNFDINENDIEFLIICSLRYTLGRSSYAPIAIIQFIKTNLENLSVKCKINILTNIFEFEFREKDLYYQKWLDLFNLIEKNVNLTGNEWIIHKEYLQNHYSGNNKRIKYFSKEELSNLTENNSSAKIIEIIKNSIKGQIFVCAVNIDNPIKIEMLKKYETRQDLIDVVNYLEGKKK